MTADAVMDCSTTSQEDEDRERFTVIGEIKRARKEKVERVLPDWLANPITVSMNLEDGRPTEQMTMMDLCFQESLRRFKIKTFFPIQVAVIPELINNFKSVSMRYRPRDICISAPTGSGKTLSYVLPILQSLRTRVVPQIRAIVLLPTQELAKQVYSVFYAHAKNLGLKICLAEGKRTLKKELSELVIEDSYGFTSADILVTTVGRLTYHLYHTKELNFKYLRYLVFDEADLFLSSSGGLMLKVEKIMNVLHRHKKTPNNGIICGDFQQKGSVRLPEPYLQQILVSATLMHDPEKLKVLNLHRPKLFITSSKDNARCQDPAREDVDKIAPYVPPTEVVEEFIVVSPNVKPLALHYLLLTRQWTGVLVFTKSAAATRSLSSLLSILGSRCYTVAPFSAQDSDQERESNLNRFTKGSIDVLVATDAMARGIDIKNINRVISYDVPSVQTYIHRIGRTGRAGVIGCALLIVEETPEVRKAFSYIFNNSKGRITKVYLPEKKLRPYGDTFENALETLKRRMIEEKKNSRLKKTRKGRKESHGRSKDNASKRRGKGSNKLQGTLSKKTNIKSVRLKA